MRLSQSISCFWTGMVLTCQNQTKSFWKRRPTRAYITKAWNKLPTNVGARVTGLYIAMRMRNITMLKFHGGWAAEMDFLFENRTFWRKSKPITIPDQSYYNFLEKKLWRISKNRIIVTLFCWVVQQRWRQSGPSEWYLYVNISGHGQCGRKRKKDTYRVTTE